ncbi:NIF3-like protein 1 [Hyperolius riggenbachi]|uniref:NIF3-like protein 1 n=1 Tax=Hyperolius riggenbachi TaxID=752182 RepID=UPI0035A34E7A
MLGSPQLKRFLVSYSLSHWSPARYMMDLQTVVSHINSLCPPALASSWDNVGLLVEPSPPHKVRKLLLTNDLTEDVMEEAVKMHTDMILSYHPPIFKPLKRLTAENWKERLVVKAIESRMAIYSPHTAWDALHTGVNVWLGKALGPSVSVPIQVSTVLDSPSKYQHLLQFNSGIPQNLLSRLKSVDGTSVRTVPLLNDKQGGSLLQILCTKKALTDAMTVLLDNMAVFHSVELLALQKLPLPDTGMGRLCTITKPVTIAEAVGMVKKHLGISHVRLALGRGKTMESQVSVVGVCAGSGSSILNGVPADLYLTGEMSHHEVLDAVSEGHTVILCEHSNSERGFLKEMQGQISQKLRGEVEVVVSQADREPLQVA